MVRMTDDGKAPSYIHGAALDAKSSILAYIILLFCNLLYLYFTYKLKRCKCRIRTYKTVGKIKFYSSWSKSKAITTKK